MQPLPEFVHIETGATVRAARIALVHPPSPDAMICMELAGGHRFTLHHMKPRPEVGDYVVDTGSASFSLSPAHFELEYRAAPMNAAGGGSVRLLRIAVVPPMDAVAECQKVVLRVYYEGEGKPPGPLVVDGEWFRAHAPEVGQLVAVDLRTGAVTLAPQEDGEVKARVPRPDDVPRVVLEIRTDEVSPAELVEFKRIWNAMVAGGREPALVAAPEAAAQMPKKITRQALEAMFESVTYEVRPDGRSTVCEITFKNGFSVDARSSAACKSEFKELLGQQAAYAKAIDKAWEFAGFMLREDRHRAGLTS